ncbi:GNAT family N-acetyltransferase [Streptomyces sp. NPDC052042]|uniref:GNAT family N-acetyltransferase n=1 Tax=Streptomyces sp. NPDC052042 TaxID=3365683 RepID=UPI0037CD000B
MLIRTARRCDLPLLQDIERAAGEPFRALGMAAVADDEPPPLDLLEDYRRAERAWVATDGDDRPIAYLIADEVDGAAHVEQVTVHPSASRRRLGSGLIDHLARWAADRDLDALTLTTFRHVPWNAPYYARLGFRVLDDAELTDGLRKIRAAETEHGLDRWPRVCMRRAAPHPGGIPRPAGTHGRTPAAT